jgi:hypothetical protein
LSIKSQAGEDGRLDLISAEIEGLINNCPAKGNLDVIGSPMDAPKRWQNYPARVQTDEHDWKSSGYSDEKFTPFERIARRIISRLLDSGFAGEAESIWRSGMDRVIKIVAAKLLEGIKHNDDSFQYALSIGKYAPEGTD